MSSQFLDSEDSGSENNMRYNAIEFFTQKDLGATLPGGPPSTPSASQVFVHLPACAVPATCATHTGADPDACCPVPMTFLQKWKRASLDARDDEDIQVVQAHALSCN